MLHLTTADSAIGICWPNATGVPPRTGVSPFAPIRAESTRAGPDDQVTVSRAKTSTQDCRIATVNVRSSRHRFQPRALANGGQVRTERVQQDLSHLGRSYPNLHHVHDCRLVTSPKCSPNRSTAAIRPTASSTNARSKVVPSWYHRRSISTNR